MALTYTTNLTLLWCCNCGVPFGMPEEMRDVKHRDHTRFFCPNGHSQVFIGKTDAQKLREARDRIARLNAENDQLSASNRGLRGAVTKKKKELAKTKAGVCPVADCHRHFANLERHIATKHPSYAP